MALVWIRAQLFFVYRCVDVASNARAKSEDIKFKISNKFKAWHFHVVAIKALFARQTDRSFLVKRKYLSSGAGRMLFCQKSWNFNTQTNNLFYHARIQYLYSASTKVIKWNENVKRKKKKNLNDGRKFCVLFVCDCVTLRSRYKWAYKRPCDKR